jgi:hypothetical protein
MESPNALLGAISALASPFRMPVSRSDLSKTLNFGYNRFEPRKIAFQILALVLLAPSSMSAACMFIYEQSFPMALRSTATFVVSFFLTLLSSLAVYRLYLHPLRRFPGPTSAALSKIKLAPLVAEGHTPDWIEQQHDKYGDFVRVGPNELSVRDLSAVQQILGASNKLDKVFEIVFKCDEFDT